MTETAIAAPLEESEVTKAERDLTAANMRLTKLQQEDTRIRSGRAQAERDLQVCQKRHQQAVTTARVSAARGDIDAIYTHPDVLAAAADVRKADEKVTAFEQDETRVRKELGRAEQDIGHCTRRYTELVRTARVMTARDMA